jgi:hypothetical protein
MNDENGKFKKNIQRDAKPESWKTGVPVNELNETVGAPQVSKTRKAA